MSEIEFNSTERDVLIAKIKLYFQRELNQNIEQFDAEFLLGFFSNEVGAYYYNKGLSDARTLLETISDAFYEIEKPTELSR